MKKRRGIANALIWFVYTVPVAACATVYYLEAVASWTQADMIALLLWGSIMLLLAGLAALISRWTEQKPGILCPGKGTGAALEILSCMILVVAGIYFRIGQEFVAFWSQQDGNPVVEAALVTLDRTSGGQTDPISATYVFLLNRVFLLVGNLSLAAAEMQLVLFIVGGILLYFLARRCYGAFTAVICLGGLMLLPQMIRASMYCSPEILLFLIAIILGWVLHLCLDRRLKDFGFGKALPDFLVLVLFTAGCVCIDQSAWTGILAETFFDRVRAVSGQAAFIPGILCAVIFLFLQTRQTAAVYMLMVVFLMTVQLLGLEDSVGCMAALGVVMSTLLGISLDKLLFGVPAGESEPAAGAIPEEAGENEPASEAKPEETVESEPASEAKPEETVENEPAAETKPEETVENEPAAEIKPEETEENEPAAETKPEEAGENEPASETKPEEVGETTVPEIYIPETMEIPKRKKRSKIDFDREFSEEEMSFDLEVEEDEEFDR